MPESRPDTQAYAEVSAYLNRGSFDALLSPQRTVEGLRQTLRIRGEEIEELVRERDDYATRLQEAQENYEIACELIGWWQHRALLLETAVRTYAEHVWNDIKRGWLGVKS